MIEPERAARLTLLALRSGVPSRLDFRPDVVRLGHNGQVVSLQDAVDDLAQRPKPLACYADVAVIELWRLRRHILLETLTA